MKSFEVKALGLEEVSENDASAINGGFAWIPVAIALIIGFLLSEEEAY